MATWPGRTSNDHAEATWNGQRFAVAHASATTELARVLMAAGCPDQPWQAYTPDGTPSLRGGSLHRWAECIVEGSRVRPYRERRVAAPHQPAAAVKEMQDA
jgi:hypothetical protein